MKTEEIDCTSETVQYGAAPGGARDVRDLIVGGRTLVPTIDGTLRPYINLDNGASTPIAVPVKAKVDEFMEWYAAVHRGSGFKSQVSTEAYEKAREIVAEFVGADLTEHTLIFVRNATEAINRCASRIALEEGDVVLTTLMEHHSNLLAWRKRSVAVETISVDDFGAPMLDDLQAHLDAHKGHVKLVAVSGGSNVTGVVPDIHRIARMVHEAGGMLLVDAAQLAPHRPINMGKLGEPECIDFLAMSAHKMYAPLGTGVLIGPYSVFEGGVPELVGGGTVVFVSEESEIFNEPPDREEAGSPNVVGAIAMAAAVRFITEQLGWDWIVGHERDLTGYALERLNGIPGLTIYGARDPSLPGDRLGVICFNLEGVEHRLTSAILSHEYAIATRTGCFCAHPYLIRLFGVSSTRVNEIVSELVCGNRTHMPGAVRMSFGFYNTREDVDAIISALWDIQNRKWRGEYRQNVKTGEFAPVESKADTAGWFNL